MLQVKKIIKKGKIIVWKSTTFEMIYLLGESYLPILHCIIKKNPPSPLPTKPASIKV